MKTIMTNIVLLVALLLVVDIGSAQKVIKEIPLKSASNAAYFQLARSTGDSTYTLGKYVDINYPIMYQGQSVSLRPDSIYVLYHITADSVASLKIIGKAMTSKTVGTYSSTFIDSIYNTTAIVARGKVLVTQSIISQSCDGGFGISVLANTTATNAYNKATAAKVYLELKCFYTLP
jgi:hypothetical protein